LLRPPSIGQQKGAGTNASPLDYVG